MAKKRGAPGTRGGKGRRTGTETSPPGRSGKRPRWLREAAAVAVLYLLTLILFWPFITRDTVFSAGGDAVAARAWGTAGRAIEAREETLPLWNPYVFCGFPTYGSLAYHPHAYYNITRHVANGLKFLFGTHQMADHIFYYFLGGIFLYLFLRGMGVPVWGALLGGVVFLLNPYNVSLAEAGHGSKHWTIIFIPLVLLLTHRALERRRVIDIALLALGAGMQLLAMHVQIAYYSLLVSGGYALVWVLARLPRRAMTALRGGGAWAGGIALAFLLSAYVYLPVQVFSKYSIRGAPPLKAQQQKPGLDWEYATNWSLQPVESLQFLVPGLFGLGGSRPPDRGLNPDTVQEYNLYWGWMPFTTSSLYMGIIPLLLAGMATVLLWRRERMVRVLAIAAFLAWVVSFGKYLPVLFAPMFKLLPYFNKFRVPSMALAVTAVGVAALAGYGLAEVWRRLREAEPPARRRWKRFFLAVLLVSAAGLLAAAVGGRGPGVSSGWFLKAGELDAYGSQQAAVLVQLRWELFRKSLLATSLVLFSFGAVGYAAATVRRGVKWAAGALVAWTVFVCALELVALDKRFLHPVPGEMLRRVTRSTETARFLRERLAAAEEPERIFAVGNLFQSNRWMRNFIPSLGGYAATKLRVYQDLLDYALMPDEGALPDWRIAGLLNAKYIVAPGRLPPPFRPIHADRAGRVVVHDNPYALPRAFFASAVEVQQDPLSVMDRLAEPGFPVDSVAIVLDNGEVAASGLVPGPVAPDTARWERWVKMPADTYRAHSLAVRCFTDRPALLVVSDVYYPQGWTAELDGEEVPILRTDYALRGVWVPAGEHEVTMRFDPPEVRAGFRVSGAAFVLVLLLLAWGVWRERRKAGTGGA